jgi:hypothetical protein
MEQKMSYMSGARAYEVETDVPVPPKKYNRKSKYPFATMQPNQSVMIPNKTYAAIMGLLRKHKIGGKKYVVRKSDGGMRVWRIE